MNLLDYISEKEIFPDLVQSSKRKVIEEILDRLIKVKKIKRAKKSEILPQLLAREKMGSTAIGNGIALPHARIETMRNIVIALGISAKGIDFDSLDSEPVYLVFLIISSQKEAGLHLKMLAHVAQLIKDKYFVNNIRDCANAAEVLKVIAKQQKFIVRP
jgi:mannitol/fructose-specific phosphotransferase system IIA component (Ntr-type)